MQSDKELLMLAAKAAGLPALDFDDELGFVGFWIDPPSSMPEEGPLFRIWNPLTDDGDALRLAVKLKMMVDQTDDTSDALLPPCAAPECTHCEPHGTDPNAATRRAITRAAASIAQAAQGKMG